MAEPVLPPFAALRAFEAVGRLGGFRRAAEALGVSHAIVSRHVRALEQMLGVALLDRATGRLTERGALFHRRIAGVIAEIAAATAAVRVDRAERLVIACAPGFALWLAEQLGDFSAKRGRPIVDLRATEDRFDLAAGEADGDIRYLRDDRVLREAADIHRIELARPEVVPVAAPTLAARISADPTRWPLIEDQDDREWHGWFAAQGIAIDMVRPVGVYGSAHLGLAAARAGQGVALGNPYLVAQDVAAGRLVALTSPDGPFLPTALGAYVFRARRELWDDPVVADFRRWLVRAVAG